MSAPAPFVGYTACVHGLAADEVRVHRDEDSGATYIYLVADSTVNIRVQVQPGHFDTPERHAVALERDRKGLRRLAAVATQIAQEIERDQRGDVSGGFLP